MTAFQALASQRDEDAVCVCVKECLENTVRLHVWRKEEGRGDLSYFPSSRIY